MNTKKKIFWLIGGCVLLLAALPIWFAGCASKAASTGAADGERGLAVEDGDNTDVAVFPQLGHTSSVVSLVFSADGRQALLSSSNGAIKLWDVTTGLEFRTFSGHTEVG